MSSSTKLGLFVLLLIAVFTIPSIKAFHLQRTQAASTSISSGKPASKGFDKNTTNDSFGVEVEDDKTESSTTSHNPRHETTAQPRLHHLIYSDLLKSSTQRKEDDGKEGELTQDKTHILFVQSDDEPKNEAKQQKSNLHQEGSSFENSSSSQKVKRIEMKKDHTTFVEIVLEEICLLVLEIAICLYVLKKLGTILSKTSMYYLHGFDVFLHILLGTINYCFYLQGCIVIFEFVLSVIFSLWLANILKVQEVKEFVRVREKEFEVEEMLEAENEVDACKASKETIEAAEEVVEAKNEMRKCKALDEASEVEKEVFEAESKVDACEASEEAIEAVKEVVKAEKDLEEAKNEVEKVDAAKVGIDVADVEKEKEKVEEVEEVEKVEVVAEFEDVEGGKKSLLFDLIHSMLLDYLYNP